MPHTRQQFRNLFRRRSQESTSGEDSSSSTSGSNPSSVQSSPSSQPLTPPSSPSRSRRPSFSLSSLGFRRSVPLSPPPPSSSTFAPVSPSTTPLAMVRENPFESESVLHIHLPTPATISPLALPPHSEAATEGSYFNLEPLSSERERDREIGRLEMQRFHFPPRASTSIDPLPSSSQALHLPNDDSPPLATRDSSIRRFTAGGGVNEPKSAWSDWGTSIASSSNANSSGGVSSRGVGGGGGVGNRRASIDSSLQQKTTDPSSIEVPAPVPAPPSSKDLHSTSSLPRMKRNRSKSTLDPELRRSSASSLLENQLLLSPDLPKLRRRSSLPDTVFPLHLQHQYTRANVQDLVKEFGYSETFAGFFNSTLVISAGPGGGDSGSLRSRGK